MEKNIYGISNYGDATNYYHFLFGTLIPLLYYDIKSNSKYSYIIKINVGNFFNILKLIFGNRVKADYIKSKIISITGDKYNNYTTYIKLLKNKNNEDVLLCACDIFYEDIFKLITKNYNHLEFKKLEELYINYHYYKNVKKDMILSDFLKTEKELFKNKNKYHQLYYTNKYITLLKYRPVIIDFFKSKIINKSEYKIILIERKIPQKISNNLQNNSAGQRRIIYNHEKLKNKLSELYKYNFLNVILDNLNIYEQFNIFHNAKIIIGQHGAGLTNIFFSKNIKLIEITPEWNDKSLKNLSKFLNFKYNEIKQDKMTKQEFELFNNKHSIIDNIEPNYINNIFKELDKPYDKYKDDPILSFIRNSGSVNINKIISKIEN
jgi:hypothetical protein